MTVDRTFLEVLKTTTPDAFSKSVPAADVVFIDGQLHLQCPASIHTWDDWVSALYIKPIQRYLAMTGVKVVVIAFDDYAHCPLSKGPTQAKRKSRCEVPTWSPLQPLPPQIPANYANLLFNRAFKGPHTNKPHTTKPYHKPIKRQRPSNLTNV